MKRIVITMVGIGLMAGVAFAQSVDELKAQLQALDSQLKAARTKAYESDQFRQLSKAASDAQAALNQAISEIPEMKEIEAKTEDLRKQMMELQQKRKELIEKTESLTAKKKAVEDARKAMRDAMGEDAMKTLYEQRMQVMRKLSEAERVAKPPTATEK